MIDFVKMHGTGNDFIVVPDLDDVLDVEADTVRRLCDRHFGVGGDGLIRIAPGDEAPFFMDYRNADGSLAEMCGNGVRVVGKWLGDRSHADDGVEVETRAGVKRLVLHRGAGGLVESVTVDMGAPVGEVSHTGDMTLVSMGNPHVVVLVDDVDEAPVEEHGAALQSQFPEGVNVEYVDVREGVLRQRTWERGVGETLACGTGACAVAVAAVHNGWARAPVDVELRGGRLHLEWDGAGSVLMTGPAVEVYSGSVEVPLPPPSGR